jgi:hypothetical protein
MITGFCSRIFHEGVLCIVCWARKAFGVSFLESLAGFFRGDTYGTTAL